MEFEWNAGNRDHIWERAQLTPKACEEAFTDPFRVVREAYPGRDGELRDGIIGKPERGRILVVFFTWREGRIRIFSARPANKREIRAYREANE